MSPTSSMILLGVGGSGSRIARGVSRAFGENLRFAMIDTDATTGELDGNFVLIGGDRLSGRGSGGDVVSAKLATEDSVATIDPALEGVRLAVITTSLGGGTGGGATPEIIRHLNDCGIRTMVFATTPFAFEGEDRQRTAQRMIPTIEGLASASFFIPLDRLVGDADVMSDAMSRATDVLASAVTMFWRFVEKPGYISLDAERIIHAIANVGHGRFAVVSAQGQNRADEIIDDLKRSVMLAPAPESGPVRYILCGILAGEDLRLSEVGRISESVREHFGQTAAFNLATVNDEIAFTGRIAVVLMLFEAAGDAGGGNASTNVPSGTHKRPRRPKSPLTIGPHGRGRFNNAEPTTWNNEDLDIPTYIRRGINLDF